MDLRAYAKAKDIYDSTTLDKRPKNKVIDLVSEITVRLAKKEIARKLALQNHD